MDNRDYSPPSDTESVDSIDIKLDKLTKIKYSDFIEHKSTRNFLIDNHLQTFFQTAEKEIKNYYLKVRDYCRNNQASVLNLDTSTTGLGQICGLVYKHIEKEYNLDIFNEYPNQVDGLIAKLEKKKTTN